MKINRYELSPAPTPQDLETLSFLQTAQRDREQRMEKLRIEMADLVGAIWSDPRDILTTNGVAPTLPLVPLVSYFFGNAPTRSVYSCGGKSLLDYPIPAHQKIGVALSSGETWLLRLDLEAEKRIALSCNGGYHQRLLDLPQYLGRVGRGKRV